jgi:hypothetical protein
LLRQTVDSADVLALFSAGNRSAAKIPMIAITTSNSIRVNALTLALIIVKTEKNSLVSVP